MMTHSNESQSKEGAAEKGSRILRNVNILGAVALAGVALVLPAAVAPAAGVWAGINAARRHFAKKRRAK